jgi:NADH-quinone oxidoreductase subunit M
MLRFHIGLFPVQARALAPYLIALAVIGILYGACLALAQRDYWRLLAFAALSHLSLIVLGIYGFTFIGSSGAIYQILNHSVIDAALFVLLGALYDRYATSQINAYGGVASNLPRTATLFVFTSLAMVGLPLLNNFVGEFLILSSTFIGISRSWTIAASLGVILGAAYMLWLVQRIFYGPKSQMVTSKPAPDLGLGELAVLCPLALLMLIMGVAPSLWLQAIEQAARSPQSKISTVMPSGTISSTFVVDSVAGEVQR